MFINQKRLQGQASTVIIFALILGVIFVLLIPARSYQAQEKVKRTAADIENAVKAHYAGEILEDYLRDKLRQEAYDQAYKLGQKGNNQRWNVTSVIATGDNQFSPNLNQFEASFLANVTQEMGKLDTVSDCFLTQDLNHNFNVESYYHPIDPAGTQGLEENGKRGFSLRLDYPDSLQVKCRNHGAVAAYAPNISGRVDVPYNRYFTLANLSTTFLHLLSVKIPETVDETSLPPDSTLEEREELMSQILRETLKETRNSSMELLTNQGLLVNESKGEVNFEVNLSQMEIDYGSSSSDSDSYWRSFDFRVPVEVKDTYYRLPTTHGLVNLTLSFPVHYELSWAR